MDSYLAENYRNTNTNNTKTKPDKCYKTIYSVTHIIISFFAIYLSWRCHNGFNVGSFLAAILCPYLYIIWALATRGGCGIFDPESIIQPIRPLPTYAPMI